MYTLARLQPLPPPAEGQTWMLTVKRDPDLGVVVFVGNLPDIKSFRGSVGQQAEEEDDGVGWGKTFRMDLPGDVKNIHRDESDLITAADEAFSLSHTGCKSVNECQISLWTLQKLPTY